jgi:hypothetical protein
MDPIVEYLQINESETFPVFRNLWDFFAAKGNKTIFVGIGTGPSPLVELHFSESLGCKLHIFEEEEENCKKWKETQDILKTRKTNDSTSDFAKPAQKKWVLPQNIVIHPSMPTFSSLKSIVSSLGENERIDILKLECSTAKTAEVLYSVLHNGYRPGILLIHWETSPDSTLETTLLAGHMQNIGYGLVTKNKNNYLYYFTDKNLYEMCSWEVSEVANPLVAKILESVEMKTSEKE